VMTLWSSEALSGDISRSGVQIPPAPLCFAANRFVSGNTVRTADLDFTVDLRRRAIPIHVKFSTGYLRVRGHLPSHDAA
jgi:hypothetical protein